MVAEIRVIVQNFFDVTTSGIYSLLASWDDISVLKGREVVFYMYLCHKSQPKSINDRNETFLFFRHAADGGFVLDGLGL